MSAPSDNMPLVGARAGAAAARASSAVFHRRWRSLVALCVPTMRVRRLHPQHPHAGDHLRDRGAGLSVVLGLCGQINLAQAAFFGFGAYAVGLGTVDCISLLALPCRRLRAWRCVGRRLPGRVDPAARRPLSGDGDDQLPADLHAGDGQLDLAHAWPGRRLEHPPARPVPDLAGLSRLLRRDAGDRRLPRLAFAGHAARARDARGARQRTRGRRHRHRRLRTKVYAFAICAVLGGLGGGLFAGGFAYVSPDQFSFADRSCS